MRLRRHIMNCGNEEVSNVESLETDSIISERDLDICSFVFVPQRWKL